MKYAVVFEGGENNFAAYVPDLPGCISTGQSKEEVAENIREVIEFHIEGLKLTGQPVPKPSSWVGELEIAVA